MSGEITSLEFTYAADAADGRQAARYTLADVLAQARPERTEELLDDLRAVAEQLTRRKVRRTDGAARQAGRGHLAIVPRGTCRDQP